MGLKVSAAASEASEAASEWLLVLHSMASGIIGMYISVKSNLRTASASRRSLVEAVQVAMRGGAVSGFLVVALSLLGVYGIFIAYGGFTNPAIAPFLID